MSPRSAALVIALVAMLLAGCAGGPAGPRPTMPHPSYAPVVVSGGDTAAQPGKGGKPRATPRPGALSDAEWRVAFCRTQDVVFGLEFAFGRAIDMAETGNLEAFRRSIRTLDNRAERARRTLLGVPARYARPLVTAELAFLRSVEQLADRALIVLRYPSLSGLRSLKEVARRSDRQWDQMVRVNRRMHESKHRLVCL